MQIRCMLGFHHWQNTTQHARGALHVERTCIHCRKSELITHIFGASGKVDFVLKNGTLRRYRPLG